MSATPRVITSQQVTPTKVHFRLSGEVTQTAVGRTFTTADVVVSHGRSGDTQIFPARPDGGLVDFISLWGRDGEHVDYNEAVAEWLGGLS